MTFPALNVELDLALFVLIRYTEIITGETIEYRMYLTHCGLMVP